MVSPSSSASITRDWEALAIDLLGCIARRLPLVDYIRFRFVCTSWANAASPQNGLCTLLTPNKPHLLLPAAEEGDGSESCTLLSLSDKQCHHISPLPEISSKVVIGSQYGWLITCDEILNLGLLNPITRAQSQLPSLTTVASLETVYGPDGTVSYFRHHDHTGSEICVVPAKNCQQCSISKITLSSSPSSGNYSAAAIFVLRKLIFTTEGMGHWAELDVGYFHDVKYHQGKFVAVSVDGEVIAIDINGLCFEIMHIAKVFDSHPDEFMYLATLFGDLLLVSKSGMWISVPEGDGAVIPGAIKIMRLDPEEGTWTPVVSLGGYSLLLDCGPVAFLARDIPGLRENCIYFLYYEYDWKRESFICRVGEFSLEDGHIRQCHQLDALRKRPTPTWIVPTVP